MVLLATVAASSELTDFGHDHESGSQLMRSASLADRGATGVSLAASAEKTIAAEEAALSPTKRIAPLSQPLRESAIAPLSQPLRESAIAPPSQPPSQPPIADGKWRLEKKCDPGFAIAPFDEFGQEGWVQGEKHADLWVVRWKCKCAKGECKRKGDEQAKTSVLQYYDFVARAPPTKKDGSPSDKPQSDENTPATVTKLYTLWTAHQAERTADLETVSLGESTDKVTNWAKFKWWEKKCENGTDFPKLAPKPRCNSATGKGCHDFSVKKGCRAFSFSQAMDLSFGPEWPTKFANMVRKSLKAKCGGKEPESISPEVQWSPVPGGKGFRFGIVGDAWASADIAEKNRADFSYFILQMKSPDGAPPSARQIKAAVQLYLCKDGSVHGKVVTKSASTYDCVAKKQVPIKWCNGKASFTNIDGALREAISYARFQLGQARIGMDLKARGVAYDEGDGLLSNKKMFMELKNPASTFCIGKQPTYAKPLWYHKCGESTKFQKIPADGSWFTLQDDYELCIGIDRKDNYYLKMQECCKVDSCRPKDQQWQLVSGSCAGDLMGRVKYTGAYLQNRGTKYCVHPQGGKNTFQEKMHLHKACGLYDKLCYALEGAPMPGCIEHLKHINNTCTSLWDGQLCMNCIVSHEYACRTVNIKVAKYVGDDAGDAHHWEIQTDGQKASIANGWSRCVNDGDLHGTCSIEVCSPKFTFKTTGKWEVNLTGSVNITATLSAKTHTYEWLPVVFPGNYTREGRRRKKI